MTKRKELELIPTTDSADDGAIGHSMGEGCSENQSLFPISLAIYVGIATSAAR